MAISQINNASIVDVRAILYATRQESKLVLRRLTL